MGNEESGLIRACRNGDQGAFAEIVRLQKHRIYRFLYGMLLQSSTAEDLTQEVFVRFWQSIDRFREEMPVYPWLRTIAYNLAVNEMKRRKAGRMTESLEAVLGGERSVSGNLEREEVRRKVADAIDALDADKRTVITLRLVEQMSYAEIAREMGCSIGTVMSRLFRARAELRDRLRPLVVEES